LLALSFLGLKAGRLPDLVRTFFAGFGAGFFATFFAVDFRAAAFFAFGFRVLRVEFRRLAMKRLAAPRAMDGSRFAQRIAEIPSTGAFGLERLLSADDAIAIIRVVGAKTAAHSATFRD
jgi:hypothetical protein